MCAMSSELSCYGSRALAAGVIHSDLVGSGRDELKKIRSAMPIGTEAVIKIMVNTDRLDNTAKIYHAATVHLHNAAPKDFRVTVTIASYVKGQYTTPALTDSGSSLLIEGPPVYNSAIQATADSSTQDVVVARHPLIKHASAMESLRSMDAAGRCPRAATVVAAVYNIFRDGVALPQDERFHHSTFSVMVRLPDTSIECIGLSYGIRGTMSRPGVNSEWSTTWVQESDDKKYITDRQKIIQLFAQLKEQAHGKLDDEIIEAGGKLIKSGTGQLTLERKEPLPPSTLKDR
jgi:hypothetical protein